MANNDVLRCPKCGGHEFFELRQVVTVYRLSMDPVTGYTVKLLKSQDLEDEDVEHKVMICENDRCNYESRDYDEWLVEASVYS